MLSHCLVPCIVPPISLGSIVANVPGSQGDGLEAADFLRAWLEGQHVELAADPVAYLLGGYGPLPRYVFHRARLVNAELVRQGYVLAIRNFRYARRQEFLALEREARLAGRGVWPPRRPCAPAGRPPCTLFQ